MSTQLLSLTLLFLVALLGHVAKVNTALVADESLNAAIETEPEISADVENEYTKLKAVENLEELRDKRRGQRPQPVKRQSPPYKWISEEDIPYYPGKE